MISIVNIRDFGAVGDGVTDDTAAIQAALLASKRVYVPQGRYILSATLIAQSNQQLYGDGPEITIFQRTANYGNTIIIGNTSPTQGASSFSITGIWFYKPQTYVAGTTTTITYPVAAGAAHLAVTLSAGALIENCWFHNMPFGITFQQSSLTNIKRCQFTGLWDPVISGLQEGVASIYLKSAGGSYNVLMTVEDSYVNGGYKSVARNMVVGTATLVQSEDIGPKYGILAEAVEGLAIKSCYLGGQSVNCVYLERQNIIAAVKIENNFFDPATQSCIYTASTSVDAMVGLKISGNNFNGQLSGRTAVEIDNLGGIFSVVGGIIASNLFENFLACPLKIYGAKGFKINDNIIAAYNIANGGSAPEFSAGIHVGLISKDVNASSNIYGGASNTFGPINNCKYGIYFSAPDKGHASNENVISFGIAGGNVVYGLDQTYPTSIAIQSPAFENGWINSGAGTQAAGYWKDSNGIVHLQGKVMAGVIGGNVFTLPIGYRPTSQVTFSTVSNDAFAYGNINANGVIVAVTGSNVYYSLDNISFKAG